MERPIHPKDRGRALKQPKNDSGDIWEVVDQDKNVARVIAHPEGNSRGFERAYLEPLDTQGRQHLQSYQDQVSLSISRLWPTR